jgi:hypothetical protein
MDRQRKAVIFMYIALVIWALSSVGGVLDLLYNVVVVFCGTMRDPGKFYSSQEVYDAYYSLQLIQFTLELVLAIVPNLGIEAVTLYGIYRIIKGNCTTASRILRVTSAAVSVVAVIGFWLGKIFARAVSMNVEIKFLTMIGVPNYAANGATLCISWSTLAIAAAIAAVCRMLEHMAGVGKRDNQPQNPD